MGVTVHLNVPTLDNLVDESNFNNINCKIYSGYPLATFSAAVHNSTQLAVKRFVDIVGALVGIILSIPVIAITAIPLLIESPGPLFFKQERVDFFYIAEEDEVGYFVGEDLVGSLEGAFFGSFGQDDALLVGFGVGNELFNEFHYIL